jgi:hypothetical protein
MTRSIAKLPTRTYSRDNCAAYLQYEETMALGAMALHIYEETLALLLLSTMVTMD